MLPHAPITTTNHKARAINTTATLPHCHTATLPHCHTANNIIRFSRHHLYRRSLFISLIKLATTGYYSNVFDMQPDAVETRIQPIGRLTMGDGISVGECKGKQVLDKVCINATVPMKKLPSPLKSPPITTRQPVSNKIAPWCNTLCKASKPCPHATAMPTISDADIEAAVVYMANQSGRKL